LARHSTDPGKKKREGSKTDTRGIGAAGLEVMDAGCQNHPFANRNHRLDDKEMKTFKRKREVLRTSGGGPPPPKPPRDTEAGKRGAEGTSTTTCLALLKKRGSSLSTKACGIRRADKNKKRIQEARAVKTLL